VHGILQSPEERFAGDGKIMKLIVEWTRGALALDLTSSEAELVDLK